MTIDLVHDVQAVFRNVLDAMSRPGKIVSLEQLKGKNDLDVPTYDITLLTILTLLDAEVTFHVIPANENQVIEKIAGYTLAKHTAIQEADFILALENATEKEIIEAMKKSKKGTLTDPHEAATWIIETTLDTSETGVRLTGPGIKEEAELHTLPASIWQVRNEAVVEFPLGIDLILTDPDFQIACVPRTTRAEVREVQ